MERFCNKCGSLVNGDGVFCPNCGASLDSVVDLGKPADAMPVSRPMTEPMMNTPVTTNTMTTGVGSNQGQMPNYGAPVYPTTPVNQTEMTTGQWVLTIFLSGLGIIGLILLFVWAFGSDTPESKRNWSKAMLIWYAISLGLVIIMYVLMFACAGMAAGGLSELFEEMEYMALFR